MTNEPDLSGPLLVLNDRPPIRVRTKIDGNNLIASDNEIDLAIPVDRSTCSCHGGTLDYSWDDQTATLDFGDTSIDQATSRAHTRRVAKAAVALSGSAGASNMAAHRASQLKEQARRQRWERENARGFVEAFEHAQANAASFDDGSRSKGNYVRFAILVACMGLAFVLLTMVTFVVAIIPLGLGLEPLRSNGFGVLSLLAMVVGIVVCYYVVRFAVAFIFGMGPAGIAENSPGLSPLALRRSVESPPKQAQYKWPFLHMLLPVAAFGLLFLLADPDSTSDNTIQPFIVAMVVWSALAPLHMIASIRDSITEMKS